ncbi:amidohydrolase [Tenacibaculum jejuense]|uniref:Metal-dependent amidohydrolase n=1 Tax=Tenacibaculum jejuense TaxID=584609 RepID=A0A238UCA9_9FLAO|nr:amidohydrolase [Tenacibaculum jejuense]SNR16809.1 Metal-dependent amidohydrolase [Tenacibaculum jejuense]
MKKIILLSALGFLAYSCQQKQKVAIIVKNANAYTVNENFETVESFAIQDGKFIAVGSTSEIENKYEAASVIDAEGKAVYPGFIDGHCHFFRFGLQLQKVDVTGTESYDAVLERLVAFQKEKNLPFITGRGWDQNDWEVKKFPTKEKLDQLFPDTPVAITRVDGHAMLVNQKALDVSGITNDSKVEGGEFIKEDGKITGVLIDNAMDFVKVPVASKAEQIQALKDAEKINFSYGLTTVVDAGLDQETIELIDSLQQADDLKIRMYAMVSATQKNLDYYIKKGIIKTDRLNVRSFKVYGDGALGSRGAALKKPYSDRHNHFGALIFSPERYKEIAKQIADSEYQMNTHAIGDSANYLMLKTYQEVLKGQTDRRWRIEHAQIVDQQDFDLFKNVIPSIQPTHATSDMYWAADRVGEERIKGGYAFKQLLNVYGKVALGTDYPVEKVNPFLTFYAAVARKDLNNYPENGYQMENALTREETLKGMTIWNAYANFEENEKGSIEVGKMADFIILDQDIMTVEINKVPKTKVLETYLAGQKVK